MDWKQFDEQLGGLLKQASEAIQTFMERASELDQIVQPELRGTMGILIVSGPRLTDDEVKELMDMLPPMVKVRFLESLKKSTLDSITEVLKDSSPYLLTQMALLVGDNTELRLNLAGTPPEDESVWNRIREAVEGDTFVKYLSIQMNEKVIMDSVPLHGETQTKTTRDKAISDDDVIDLKAALGKSQTVEQFMDEMFGKKGEDSDG